MISPLKLLQGLDASLSAVISRGMDFILPPLCPVCEQTVLQAQTLCADCWRGVNFIDRPLCSCCGRPFDFPVEEGTLCGACSSHPPVYDSARSVFLYDDGSKGLVLRLKHADQLHALPFLADWMVRAGVDFWELADLIVPVPLHRWRFLRRRYNQSALLAQAIGTCLGVEVVVDALVRTRATLSQGRMSKKQRQKNVAGVFAMRRGVSVRGLHVVLIDDVLTSGATVNECARVLKEDGAACVSVLTLARA